MLKANKRQQKIDHFIQATVQFRSSKKMPFEALSYRSWSQNSFPFVNRISTGIGNDGKKTTKKLKYTVTHRTKQTVQCSILRVVDRT